MLQNPNPRENSYGLVHMVSHKAKTKIKEGRSCKLSPSTGHTATKGGGPAAPLKRQSVPAPKPCSSGGAVFDFTMDGGRQWAAPSHQDSLPRAEEG